MVEYDFPRWDFLLAYPASKHPSIREAAEGGRGGCSLQPTVENHMPSWDFKSHRFLWNLTIHEEDPIETLPIAVCCVVTWLLHFYILNVSAWKDAMGAMQKGVTHVMNAMAKRRPWQKGTLEKCHGTHGKKTSYPPKGILSGPHGAS